MSNFVHPLVEESHLRVKQILSPEHTAISVEVGTFGDQGFHWEPSQEVRIRDDYGDDSA